MIKGVNKRIIEVLNPEETCFEKIILFLNPNCNLSEQFLLKNTGDYVKNIAQSLASDQVLNNKKQKSKPLKSLLICLSLLLSAGVGAGIAFLIT